MCTRPGTAAAGPLDASPTTPFLRPNLQQTIDQTRLVRTKIFDLYVELRWDCPLCPKAQQPAQQPAQQLAKQLGPLMSAWKGSFTHLISPVMAGKSALNLS